MEKNRKDAGADELTPSVAQYFSWINNTNEGSTERQTLINLEFFKWLRDTYGMQIAIYAWDAGNFDGAGGTYGSTDSEHFKKSYPNGWGKIVKTAAEGGIRLGLWGGPDGFGSTPEEQRRRYENVVRLCRDYRFAEFKIDAVCGGLREDKTELFEKMLRECREYSPDLIVLNHRLDLHGAEKYATTFLWNGDETYTDVSVCNKKCAMHNREYMFSRGHVPELRRLCEDHGVCVSSCIDYFEDELIYQAFNRALILAPELYGNPWLMRDDEFALLARIYRMQKRNAALLCSGMLLPDDMGANACSRGDGKKRLISTGNDTWEKKDIILKLDESIGLCGGENKRFAVNLRHPYEEHLGVFDFGSEVTLTLMPFRAALIEVAVPEAADPVVAGAKYITLRDGCDGVPEIKTFEKAENCSLIIGGAEKPYAAPEPREPLEAAPKYLGSLDSFSWMPADGERLYEAAVFAADNDSLEARSLRRSGETAVPQVKAARDAFFSQETYRLRGCESAAMFDGRDDTFFDSQSKTYCGSTVRINGGCLRVDFGSVVDADTLEVECFVTDTVTAEVMGQSIPGAAECSDDLSHWRTAQLSGGESLGQLMIDVVRFTVHDIYKLCGKKVRLTYRISGGVRYIRIPEPPDRIYAVRLKRGGQDVTPKGARANNLQSPYQRAKTVGARYGDITLPENYRCGSRLAVAIDGEHGSEAVYCCAEIGGTLAGFPQRAPEYKANMWEHKVIDSDRNYTYFLPLPEGLESQTVRIWVPFSKYTWDACDIRVYICDPH